MVLKMVLMVMGFFKYTESKCVTIITKMGIAQFTKKMDSLFPAHLWSILCAAQRRPYGTIQLAETLLVLKRERDVCSSDLTRRPTLLLLLLI